MKKLSIALITLSAIFASDSCSPDSSIIPSNILNQIQSIQETPVATLFDSLSKIPSITVNYVPDSFSHGGVEFGYTFQASAPGTIIQLGLRLPDINFTHTVTLWDSATQTILAEADILNQSSLKFSYVNLAANNQQVVIQPNHTYIISWNSLSKENGATINSGQAGNHFYYIQMWEGSTLGTPNYLTIFPFMYKHITVTACYLNEYPSTPKGGGNPFAITPFPIGHSVPGIDIYGLCDIDYIPL